MSNARRGLLRVSCTCWASARTFATYLLRGFDLAPSGWPVPVIAVAVIMFSWLVNASGNRSVGLFSTLMATLKVGGIAVFAWFLSALLVGKQRRILPGIVLSGVFGVATAIVLVWGYAQFLIHVTGISESSFELGSESAENMAFGRDAVMAVVSQIPLSVRVMPVVFGLAFVLPMIHRLARGRARARMPRCLILCPTRELAAQVAENFEKYGKYLKRLTKQI